MTNKVQPGEIWHNLISEKNVRILRVDPLNGELLMQYVSDCFSATEPFTLSTDEFLKCFDKIGGTAGVLDASYYLKMHGLYIEVEDDSMISFYEDSDDLAGFRSLDFAKGAIRDLPKMLHKYIEIEEQAKQEILVKLVVWGRPPHDGIS